MDNMKLNRINLKIKEHLSNCSKNIELFLSFSEKNKTKDMNKKLEYLKKELETIQKLIFDPKILSEQIYEQIVELELIKTFISYCALQEESLIILFLPFINLYLFPNSLIGKHQNDDLYELLLMNSSTLNSIKILNSTLIKFLKKSDTEIILELAINFLDELLKKFVIYPNFYYSISSSNQNDSEFNFDAELFEFVVEIFSKEYFLFHRKSRSKLRKAILLCLNLENFYTIKKQYIFNLFDYFVDNLTRYYQNYKSFEVDNLKKGVIKKEGISINEMEEVFKYDVISYLTFINIFIRCLEDSSLKYFMKEKIFNKFLVDNVQRDLIMFQKLFNPFTEKKLIKVMEFIFFLTKYLTNTTISELLFSFIFGFDNIINKDKPLIQEELENNNDYLDYEKTVLITCEADQSIFEDLDFNSIQKNLHKLDIRMNTDRETGLNLINTKNDNNKNINNYTRDNLSEYINLDPITNRKLKNYKLDMNNYNNEAILTFFIKVLSSESLEEMLTFKITLLNILIKLLKNCSGLFLIEVLIPYYINYIHINSPKFFDGFLEKLVNYNERFVISEIISILLPKFYTMNFNQWESYFHSALENNYKRNCELLDKESNLTESNLFENLENFNSNIFTNDNSIIDFNFTRKNHSGQGSNDSNFLDNDDILEFNNINISNNKFSCFLNVNERRITFYETLILYFKNFTSNNYKENLFLSELFLEIFSVPMISNLGENGNKIYNIYLNITYYSIKKHFLYNISAVGILGAIENSIDENIRMNSVYNDENNNNTAFNTNQNTEKHINYQSLSFFDKIYKNNISNKSINYNTVNYSCQKSDTNFSQFLDNANLYVETFKEFISNLYCKRYFDMINLNNLNQSNR